MHPKNAYHWSSKGTPSTCPPSFQHYPVSKDGLKSPPTPHLPQESSAGLRKSSAYKSVLVWHIAVSLYTQRGWGYDRREKRRDSTVPPGVTLLGSPLPQLCTQGEAACASQSRGTSASLVLSENKLPVQYSPAAGRNGT